MFLQDKHLFPLRPKSPSLGWLQINFSRVKSWHTGSRILSHEETALEDTNDQWARQDPVLFMLLTSRTFNVKYTRPKTSNDACVVEALLTLKKWSGRLWKGRDSVVIGLLWTIILRNPITGTGLPYVSWRYDSLFVFLLLKKKFFFNWKVIACQFCWFLPYINMNQP